MTERHHKGHTINAKTHKQTDGRWKYELFIYREHGSYGTDARFIGQTAYDSEQQCIDAAIAVAKRKIDDGYDDSKAVNNLPASAVTSRH